MSNLAVLYAMARSLESRDEAVARMCAVAEKEALLRNLGDPECPSCGTRRSRRAQDCAECLASDVMEE